MSKKQLLHAELNDCFSVFFLCDLFPHLSVDHPLSSFLGWSICSSRTRVTHKNCHTDSNPGFYVYDLTTRLDGRCVTFVTVAATALSWCDCMLPCTHNESYPEASWRATCMLQCCSCVCHPSFKGSVAILQPGLSPALPEWAHLSSLC